MALIHRNPVAEPQIDDLPTNTIDPNLVPTITSTTTSPDIAAPAAAQPTVLATSQTLETSLALSPSSVDSAITGIPLGHSSTISPTSTPTSRSTHETSSPSATEAGGTVSPAEAGGIAVGAAVGGAILAVLVLLAFPRLRRHRRDRTEASPLFAEEEKKNIPRVDSVLDHLPQGFADETFRQKLGKLSTDIKNFVDSFFNEAHLQLDASTEASLQTLAGPPVTASSWSAAFLNDKTRRCVIRLLIAQLLFKSIHPQNDTDVNLLPHQLLAAYQIFQKGPQNSKRERGFGSDIPSRKTLLVLWRQISSHLFPAELRIEQNHAEVGKIAYALAPLHPDTHGSFHRILESLVQDAGQLGLELFADAHEWEPIWTQSHNNVNGAMVVFPGVQLSRRSTGGEQHHDDMEIKVTLTSCIVEY